VVAGLEPSDVDEVVENVTRWHRPAGVVGNRVFVECQPEALSTIL
jgi:hypothetical protein